MKLPDMVKAGDPVLHEPAREVNPDEIESERIQKIIDDMVEVMSVDGYRAVVEKSLDVEVTGLDRDAQPIKVNANGWLGFYSMNAII